MYEGRKSILPDKFKTFEYYKNKLPLFLQNSYGFIEHFRLWYDFMIVNRKPTESLSDRGVINTCDLILYLLDIFDEDFINVINSLDGASTNDNGVYDKSDILDKLGALMGVKRSFSVTYLTDEGEQVTEDITLDNNDFLILIKGQIIKNYCEGTYEQIRSYYENAGLAIYVTTGAIPATSNLYLAKGDELGYSDNIVKMFKAGLLLIRSMGIQYNFYTAIVDGFLIWGEEGTVASNQLWDIGVWVK